MLYLSLFSFIIRTEVDVSKWPVTFGNILYTKQVHRIAVIRWCPGSRGQEEYKAGKIYLMQAHAPRIIVHSLVVSTAEAQLIRQLKDIGYSNVVVSRDRDYLVTLSRDSYPAVVLQLIETANCHAALLEMLDLVKPLPMMVLFSKHDLSWDQRIFASCDEVITWPCSLQELDFRMRNLTTRCGKEYELDNGLFIKMNILGNSPEFLKVLDKISKITKCDVPVFIDGETGTGKELVARAIHYLSGRKSCPFVAANCGALPDQLIENELYGHDKGAYTDARESRDGLVAQAEGGTLFLDEIETLSHKGQITLLRFLEDMQYRPLGSKSVKTANLRIISATNEPIMRLVEEGTFRKDLYYRLNIMDVMLPPLRERSGDIQLLAEHFIKRYQSQYNQSGKELHPKTLEGMQYYDWPGNVRELENVLHREFLLATDKCISIKEFENAARERRSNPSDRRFQQLFCQSLGAAKTKLISDFEQQYLSSALDRANGNISKAARLAGKERRAFTRLLEKYSINSAHYRNH